VSLLAFALCSDREVADVVFKCAEESAGEGKRERERFGEIGCVGTGEG
jgi:hypothetical protein